jgi:hypothetical protein
MKTICPFKEQKLLHKAKVNHILERVVADEYDCQILIKYIKKFIKEGLSSKGKTHGESKGRPKKEGWKVCDDIFIKNDFMDDKDNEFSSSFYRIWNEIDDFLQYYIVHVGAGDITNVGLPYDEWGKLKKVYNHPKLWYEVPKLRRYKANIEAYNKAHFDRNLGEDTIVSSRVISGLLYLNTIKEGGETVFPLHEKEIKPIQGKIVLFPSSFTHIHYGKPPKNENRYNIIIHSRNRKE